MNFVNVVFFGEFFDFVSSSHNFYSADGVADFIHVVVDDADGDISRFVGTLHFGYKRRSRLSRADYHGSFLLFARSCDKEVAGYGYSLIESRHSRKDEYERRVNRAGGETDFVAAYYRDVNDIKDKYR